MLAGMSKMHGFIGAEQLARVKASISLPDLVGEVVKLRKDGKGFAGLCPFHQERTPSFGLFEKDAGWQFYCHGCHAKGDAIAWMEKRDGLEFQEAVEALADRAGIRLIYEKGHQRTEQVGPKKSDLKAACAAAAAWFAEQLAEEYGADALDYLANRRRLTEETIAAWQLGWAPGNGQCCAHLMAQGFGEEAIVAAGLGRRDDRGLRDVFWRRVMIPIRDQAGAVVAFAGRILPVDDVPRVDNSKPPKYINTSETSIYHKGDLLFGLHAARAAIQADESATLVEGQLDVICAHQLGLTTAVACCGTAFTPAHADRLRPLIGSTGRLVLLLDGDAAGAKATAASIATAWQRGMGAVVRTLADTSTKDLGDVVAQGLPLALSPAVAGDQWLIRHLIPQPAPDVLDRLPQADAVLAVIKLHCDADWRELVAERLAAHLGFAGSKFKSRLKVPLGGAPDPEIPETPGMAAAGAMDGAEVRDGGLHQAIVAKLRDFLIAERVEPDAVGGWLQVGTDQPVHRTTSALASDFWYRYAGHFQSLSTDRVRHTLEPMVATAREDRRARVLSPILDASATDAGRQQLVRWVRAVTGGEDPTDIAVVAHFLWQVKRRSAGLRVAHDVMPIVVGLQGNGKSVAVEKLCSPLHELVRGVNVTDLTDDRNKAGLASFHVGIWDELAGGSKADLQALKHTVTANSVSFRVLSTHTIAVLPKRMTLIATSNDDVADIITDTTGARRFYQLNCLQRCDWDAINAIDYLVLWQAVHQDDQPPFEAVQDEIRLRQAKLVHKSLFEQWLEAEQFGEISYEDHSLRGPDGLPSVFRIGAYDPTRGEAKDSMRKRLAHWCKLHGHPALSAKEWGMGLKRNGFRDIGRPIDPITSIRPTSPMMQLPAVIPDHWPVADRLPRSTKNQAERQASVEKAIAAFTADDRTEILPHEPF